MGRRLPWQHSADASSSNTPVKSENVKAESPAIGKSARHGPPSATATASASAPTRTPVKRHLRGRDSDLTRSPSTSPPPEPPVESFMIPGPANDDRYRMVEDEFLHTAQQFTNHLHRAEYNRLKAFARSQGAAMIRDIQRPVVGPATAAARRKEEMASRNRKQQWGGLLGGLQGGDAAKDEAEGKVTIGSKSLRGLMESPRKEVRNISGLGLGVSKTRAAAGLGSGSSRTRHTTERSKHELDIQDVDTDDEPEMSSPIQSTRRMATTNTTARQTPAQVQPSSRGVRVKTPSSVTTPKYQYSSSSRVTASSGAKQGQSRNATSWHPGQDAADDDDDPFGINKRMIHREKSRETLRRAEDNKTPSKKLSPDTIPSFL